MTLFAGYSATMSMMGGQIFCPYKSDPIMTASTVHSNKYVQDSTCSTVGYPNLRGDFNYDMYLSMPLV
jgi:hypothetical protein